MDISTFWDQLRALLGLDSSRATPTVATILQVLLVVLVTWLVARWAGGRARTAVRSRRATADIASLVGRATAFAVAIVGVSLILSILGLNLTAIVAILGAATFGISLALQDVAKAFVNGLYVLIERPFRIGDRIRIADVEGRVEDIGIRLVRLRTDAGERVLLPSTFVFTSNIEKETVGNYDRRRYTMTDVERPVLEIEAAVFHALKGAPHLSARLPFVEIVSSGPEGTRAFVTIEHDLGNRVDDQVISRLRAEFPEAAIATRLAEETP